MISASPSSHSRPSPPVPENISSSASPSGRVGGDSWPFTQQKGSLAGCCQQHPGGETATGHLSPFGSHPALHQLGWPTAIGRSSSKVSLGFWKASAFPAASICSIYTREIKPAPSWELQRGRDPRVVNPLKQGGLSRCCPSSALSPGRDGARRSGVDQEVASLPLQWPGLVRALAASFSPPVSARNPVSMEGARPVLGQKGTFPLASMGPLTRHVNPIPGCHWHKGTAHR